MTDFDRIRNLIIEYEHENYENKTEHDLLNDICNVCFARNIREHKQYED